MLGWLAQAVVSQLLDPAGCPPAGSADGDSSTIIVLVVVAAVLVATTAYRAAENAADASRWRSRYFNVVESRDHAYSELQTMTRLLAARAEADGATSKPESPPVEQAAALPVLDELEAGALVFSLICPLPAKDSTSPAPEGEE